MNWEFTKVTGGWGLRHRSEAGIGYSSSSRFDVADDDDVKGGWA